MPIEECSLFEVRESPIEGCGVFAIVNIPKGQRIWDFQGEKITISQLKEKYASGEERIDDPFQINNDLYIVLEEPYIFSNHSCEPNAGVKGVGTLFALRDISIGEEITYDYSSTECTDDASWGINWTELWKIPCKCGSSQCRKEIRVFDLLPEDRKQYYFEQGALMDYILVRADERS